MRNIRYLNLFILFGLTTLLSCSPDEGENPVDEPDYPTAPSSVSLQEAFFYNINLNDRTGDSFKVRVFIDGLTDANAVFQFAATAPGTYEEMNFGNYVSDFKAYDEEYEPLTVTKISENQFKLDQPSNTAIIEYEIHETWDEINPVDYVHKMAGTSIEEDHSLINTFAVMGYPTGLQEKKYIVSIDRPSNWLVGTALPKNNNGYYVAQDYDQLADSPILMGDLTNATINLGQTEIDIWTYSQTGVYTSADIKDQIQYIMNDEKAFLKDIPVDKYTFLYHFEDSNGEELYGGALEHSYSSLHVIDEAKVEQNIFTIKYYAAHEFFHILTPLNLHSEIIEDFNFVTPTPSRHLWLYEGVTEWAAWMVRYRNNYLSLDYLLRVFESKIAADEEYYDNSYSLVDISLNSYTPEGAEQFHNVYLKGAMVAALLDIRLLELSNGERGLREVLLELAEIYGPENAFPDDQFFEILTDMTYPEIGDFIENYIKGTKELPYQEYFIKIGIEYDPATNAFHFTPEPTEEQLFMFERWNKNL